MTEILRPDLCVIGGGPGGLAAARLAAQLGGKVVLVERRLGIEEQYLRTAWQIQALQMLAARHAAVRAAAKFGLAEPEARIDLKRMRHEVEAAQVRFLAEDSPARLAGLSIKIIQAAGEFTSPSRFQAGDFMIDAHYFLLAFGSLPAPLFIPGIELARPLTADRVAELATVPRRLIVIGTSEDSLPLAQAFLRLGSKVTLLTQGAFLQGEDPELSLPLRNALQREGLDVIENAQIKAIELSGSGLQAAGLKIVFASGESLDTSHLICAQPRVPVLEGLGLKAAHVVHDKEGVQCDANRRSSNWRIYAIGEGHDSLESIARARREAEFVVELIFGRRPSPLQMARIIATDPEIAIIGLSEDAARAKHKKIGVLRAGFCDNLRARAAVTRMPDGTGGSRVPGHVKIITDSRGVLLGAGVIGPQARELIGILGLGLAKGAKAADLTALATGAPTLSDIWRTATLASALQTGKVGKWRPFAGWLSSR